MIPSGARTVDNEGEGSARAVSTTIGCADSSGRSSAQRLISRCQPIMLALIGVVCLQRSVLILGECERQRGRAPFR